MDCLVYITYNIIWGGVLCFLCSSVWRYWSLRFWEEVMWMYGVEFLFADAIAAKIHIEPSVPCLNSSGDWDGMYRRSVCGARLIVARSLRRGSSISIYI